jgi:MoaA/NifB/PqqE/SkfB family radical SAM enzyme
MARTCSLAAVSVPAALLGVDRAASDRVVDTELAADTLLRPSQHHNLRTMADDLYEGRLVWKSVPLRLNLELHERCNEACVYCDVPRGSGRTLGTRALERLLDEVGWGVVEVMPLLGSEPTLGPLEEVARLLRPHNVFLNLITNGVRMTPRLVDAILDVTSRIQFSIPSHRLDAYRQVMPISDFTRVLANLDHVIAAARSTGTQVAVAVVPTAHNLTHLDEWVRFFADRGVDRVVVSKLFEGTKRYDEFAAELHLDADVVHDAYERILGAAIERDVFLETCADALVGRRELPLSKPGRFQILLETSALADLYRPGFCMATATTAFVQADGTVQPCVRDRIELGVLPKDDEPAVSFDTIWNGPAMQALRRTHFTRELRPHCAKCSAYFHGHP